MAVGSPRKGAPLNRLDRHGQRELFRQCSCGLIYSKTDREDCTSNVFARVPAAQNGEPVGRQQTRTVVVERSH